MDLVEAMRRNGVPPDHITYSIMLNACAKVLLPPPSFLIESRSTIFIEIARWCFSYPCPLDQWVWGSNALPGLLSAFGRDVGWECAVVSDPYQKAMTLELP